MLNETVMIMVAESDGFSIYAYGNSKRERPFMTDHSLYIYTIKYCNSCQYIRVSKVVEI